ncbi:hypothetical protein VH570_01265 [Sphingobium sp. HT1-2]|uniref:hypothetical protein n=1 Tax=Sphingobium sp. HT1-2 TaxID=3111640 RepID=UPI003C055FEC
MNTYQPQKNPFLERRPYVYAIMWTELNVAYVGVRYAKGCHPNDFWKTYFTSSEHVAAFRQKHGDPDHIEIIDTFLTQLEALTAEHEIIRDFGLHETPTFLNKTCGRSVLYTDAVRDKLRQKTKARMADPKQRDACGEPSRRRIYEYRGKAYCLTELAALANTSAAKIGYRLKHGCSVEQAVELPNSTGRSHTTGRSGPPKTRPNPA